MVWVNLPVDYKDAVWDGKRKFRQIDNDDGTVSFEDVTVYIQKEKAFFGAKEANAMNAGMNQLAANMDSVASNTQKAESAAATATQKASAAASSVTAAAQSQQAAAASASNALRDANTATQKANEASNAQSAAAQSASAANASATTAEQNAKLVKVLLYNNAGSHNSFYRGKDLGTSVTAKQWNSINNGTFEDMYLGDYWTINGRKYLIAGFDYYYNSGSTACTTHHVTLIPDKSLYHAKMNDSDTTTGGYVNSAMFKSNLTQARNTIKSDFSNHVLMHKRLLSNNMTNGRPSGWVWIDSEIELPSESMMYGILVYNLTYSPADCAMNVGIETRQLPLFALNSESIHIRENYWLRDVALATHFINVNAYGRSTADVATKSCGVRPIFSIRA